MASMHALEHVLTPSACTLPTAERRLRIAECDRLVGEAVRSVSRSTATQLDVVISPTAAWVFRDLVQREADCCSFFRFNFEPAGDEVLLRISVPPAHAEVLDALQVRVDSIVARDGDTP
jgi:hypothetical protein